MTTTTVKPVLTTLSPTTVSTPVFSLSSLVPKLVYKPSIPPYIDCGCLEVDQCGPPFGLPHDDPRMRAGYPRIYSKDPSCKWRRGRPRDTYRP